MGKISATLGTMPLQDGEKDIWGRQAQAFFLLTTAIDNDWFHWCAMPLATPTVIRLTVPPSVSEVAFAHHLGFPYRYFSI